jgi:lipopolysaccharide export system protein LptA
VMTRTFSIAAAAVFAGASFVSAQSLEEPKLPRLDVFSGKRTPLGYEGTPLAKKEKEVKKPKGETEINALEATFDQKTREAVFIGDVVVKDPEFTVTCDRLTAFLKQQKNGAKATVPADPPPTNEPSAAEAKGGGLDHAIAEAAKGNEVTIMQDKFEADGTITKNVGRAKKATFDSKTGDIVLTGSPSVQQGINLCIAQSEDTVMTLNRNGRMKVEGPHTTRIKDTESVGGLAPR